MNSRQATKSGIARPTQNKTPTNLIEGQRTRNDKEIAPMLRLIVTPQI